MEETERSTSPIPRLALPYPLFLGVFPLPSLYRRNTDTHRIQPHFNQPISTHQHTPLFPTQHATAPSTLSTPHSRFHPHLLGPEKLRSAWTCAIGPLPPLFAAEFKSRWGSISSTSISTVCEEPTPEEVEARQPWGHDHTKSERHDCLERYEADTTVQALAERCWLPELSANT
jgi:hypothetical protein